MTKFLKENFTKTHGQNTGCYIKLLHNSIKVLHFCKETEGNSCFSHLHKHVKPISVLLKNTSAKTLGSKAFSVFTYFLFSGLRIRGMLPGIESVNVRSPA